MITIFTIPKPFLGLDEIHQRNAIQSWLTIEPKCEIILCGNDEGVAAAAREYGILHIPEIPTNEFGTPYLNHAFIKAQEMAKHDLICYVNADIIFPNNLISIINSISFTKFLVVGRRHNLDIEENIDFQSSESVDHHLWNKVTESDLYTMAGSDYFIFIRNSIKGLPNFTVGRPGWDNWMFYYARKNQYPLIDATEAIVAIHQNHGYEHVRNGRNDTWEGPEGDRNREIIGAQGGFTLWDATHFMDQTNIVNPVKGDHYLKRRIQSLPILKPRTGVRGKWQMFINKVLMGIYYRRKWVPYPVFSLLVNTLIKLS